MCIHLDTSFMSNYGEDVTKCVKSSGRYSQHMYIHVYICIVYVYTYAYIYVYIYLQTYKYTLKYAFMYVYMYVGTCVSFFVDNIWDHGLDMTKSVEVDVFDIYISIHILSPWSNMLSTYSHVINIFPCDITLQHTALLQHCNTATSHCNTLHYQHIPMPSYHRPYIYTYVYVY